MIEWRGAFALMPRLRLAVNGLAVARKVTGADYVNTDPQTSRERIGIVLLDSDQGKDKEKNICCTNRE